MNVNGLSQRERSSRVQDDYTVSVDCVHPDCGCEDVEVRLALATIATVPTSCVLCGRAFDHAQQAELAGDARAILAAYLDNVDPTP